MRAAFALVERELRRFFRQKNRLVGALLQPVIFWLLFGAAFEASLSMPTYAFFLPGFATLTVLFTAIFSTMSIIEDRSEGFLQAVLVAPVGRGWMVLGKVLGGTILAVLQGTLFLLLAPLAGVPLAGLGLLGAVGILGALGFSLTSLGFLIAWRMDSTQGYHAIMSVFLMPMWLLSGAFFPAEGLGPALAWILRLNPMTYGVDALRHCLGLPGERALAASVSVSLLFAVVMFLAAARVARRPAQGDLR